MGLLRKDNSHRPLIVGICGRSCSGKSGLTEAMASFNREVLLLQADCYFKRSTSCRFGGYQCWEHTECVSLDRLADDLRSLRGYKETVIHVETPWMPQVNVRISRADMQAKKLIVVDGFLIFAVKELADLFDYKVFIDASDFNILYRRQMRDGVNQVNYVHDVVIPVSKEYEQAQRHRSDLVIDGNRTKEEVVNEAFRGLSKGLPQLNPFRLSSKGMPWKARHGDLVMDTTWHPIDFDDCKEWVKKEKARLDAGEELKGNTFRYRRNPNAGTYEIRLSSQYNCGICRYTHEPTQPWRL